MIVHDPVQPDAQLLEDGRDIVAIKVCFDLPYDPANVVEDGLASL